MSTSSGYPPHRLGAWGEALAHRRLREDGWTVLARNYRLGRREVDLVVAREDTLAFVEVKTRAGRAYGAPEAAVTRRKRREIEAVARAFLADHPHWSTDVRLDVIAIEVDGHGKLARYEHLEDAWRPEP